MRESTAVVAPAVVRTSVVQQAINKELKGRARGAALEPISDDELRTFVQRGWRVVSPSRKLRVLVG